MDRMLTNVTDCDVTMYFAAEGTNKDDHRSFDSVPLFIWLSNDEAGQPG